MRQSTRLKKWFFLFALSWLLVVGCGPGTGGGDGGGDATTDPDTPTGDTAGDPDGGSDGDATDGATADGDRVRPNSRDLTAEQWASIRAGVAAMKGRPASDPTSWLYQANIHGTYDTPASEAWNTCQHGSYYFLSWHRMYLYFFERILRDAAGDPDLNLPFWDYTDPTQRAIPEAFRSPADPSNPLFVAERNGGINTGAQLPASATRFDVAMGFTNFTSPTGSPLGFGGQLVSGPQHFGSPHGQIESQPHDIIHVLVGGQTGWMSDPNLAARDAIFWFHHANIDRLWDVWISRGGGRSNPNDDNWLNTEFTFFDVGGTRVTLSGAEVVDAAGQLGYTYAEGSGSAPGTEADVEDLPAEPFTDDVQVEISSQSSDAPLGAATAFALEVPPASTQAEGDRPERFVLMVEDLDFGRPGVYYEVYVGLPDDTSPDPLGPFFVGSMAVFGQGVESGGHAHAQAATLGYDVTRVVERLRESGDFDGGLPVRFVRRGLDDESAADASDVRLARVRVVRE